MKKLLEVQGVCFADDSLEMHKSVIYSVHLINSEIFNSGIKKK